MIVKMLTFTKHAITQLQRRGKTAEGARLVMRYGKLRNGRYILTGRDVRREIDRRRILLANTMPSNRRRRAVKRRIHLLEKMRGCAVVVSGDIILTVYNETKKRARNRNQRRGKR